MVVAAAAAADDDNDKDESFGDEFELFKGGGEGEGVEAEAEGVVDVVCVSLFCLSRSTKSDNAEVIEEKLKEANIRAQD